MEDFEKTRPSKAIKARGHRDLAWRRFRGNRPGMAGAAGLIVLCLLALMAPWLTPYGYGDLDLAATDQSPSFSHPMGTDLLGRDVLTLVLYGGRSSIGLALIVGGLSSLIGVAVGLASGYYGRWLDAGFMGLTDFALVLPLIPLILAVKVAFGYSPAIATLLLSLLLWPRMARLVRGQVLSIRGRGYVEAAQALGVPDVKVMLRHVLPNVMGIVAVEATLVVTAAILTESVLSYLTVLMCSWDSNCPQSPGLDSAVASWGALLADYRLTMTLQWWTTFFPGLMIALVVLCANFLGDSLRQAFDPKNAED